MDEAPSQMIDWDCLRVVLAVHRRGGLKGAASDLRVSQPTVSRHLARAEADLGCKLFDRRQGRLVATEAGMLVIREAAGVEQQLCRMQDRIRTLENDMSGQIALSVPQQLLPYCLAEEIRDFQLLHPGIAFRLVVSDTLADLSDGSVDVVVRAEDNPRPSLWGRRIGELGYGYYAHRTLIETFSPGGLPLTEADRLPLIVHDGIRSSALEEMQTLFPNGRVAVRTGSLEACIALVATGQGVGRLPDIATRGMADLKPVAAPLTRGKRSLWILTHKDLRDIRRIAAFIEFVHMRMQDKGSLFDGPF